MSKPNTIKKKPTISWAQWLWFIALWCGGVGALALVSLLLKWLTQPFGT